MKRTSSRRSFLKHSAAISLTAPLAFSFEERALAAVGAAPPKLPPGAPVQPMPTGKIGNVTISRLICGGNLISGYAHSRDLIYVSPLLKHYFDDEKILETWSLCEHYGINTMILNPSNRKAVSLYERHRGRGGNIQYLAQIVPENNDLKTPVKQAKDAGAVGAFLQGNSGDVWTREGKVPQIGEFLGNIRAAGLICGVAGHSLRTVKAAEEGGLKPDFYMKTLHSDSYWSARRPEQTKEVVDAYSTDNYWCMDAKDTINYMSEIDRPWMAYKVLAAGAIHPRAGFRYAFQNGADFAVVGMFDFQVGEDAAIAAQVVQETTNRDRAWVA